MPKYIPQNKEFLTINEASRFLKVSAKTLRRWEAKGLFYPIRTEGGHRRYRRDDVINFSKKKAKKNYSSKGLTFSSLPKIKSAITPATANTDWLGNSVSPLRRRINFKKIIAVFPALALIFSLTAGAKAAYPKVMSYLTNHETRLGAINAASVLAEKIELKDIKYEINVPSVFNANLTVNADATISGNLSVSGEENTIAGTLTLSGNTLSATGDLTISPNGGGVRIGTTGTPTIDLAGGDLYIAGALEVGESITLNGDTITDLTGTGLTVSNGILNASLGTSVNPSEIDVTNTPSGGQILSYDSSTGNFKWANDNSGSSSPFTTTSNVVNLNTSTDDVTIGSATALGKFAVDGDSDEVQILAQAYSTQTSDILVLEQSDGTDILSVGNTGNTTLTNSGTSNIIFNLSSTGDFAIQDNGSTFATFTDSGTFTLDNLSLDGNTLSSTSGNLTLSAAGSIVLSGFDCTGFTNGGALTTDASGVISCSNDDGGGGSSDWTSTGGVVYLQTTTNNVNVGGTTNLGKLAVDGDTDEVQILIQGNATQTNFLGVFEQSDGTDVFTIANSGDLVTAGDLAVNGGDITTSATTFNLLNATPTTINFAGAATTLNIGANSGTTTFNNDVTINGTLTTAASNFAANGATTLTPSGTNDVTMNLDADSTLILSGVQSGTASSALCLDASNNVITCSTSSGVTLQTAYGNDADGSDAIIALTSADDSVVIRNPASGGTDSSYVFQVDQLSSGTTDNVHLTQAGTGTVLDVSSSSTGKLLYLTSTGAVTTADGVVIEATNAGGVITDAIDASDAEIVNAINIGANVILGTTGTINFTNFDVASTGNITVASGVGLDTNGAGTLAIGTTNATALSLGSSGSTFALTSSGGLNVSTSGALTGVDTIDTISFAATTITFAGAGTISSTTTNAITLDSGTTGAVNVGTGNNSKTINVGTGTAGNNINIGTDNTTADTITIGSALDSLALTSANWTIASSGAANFVSIGATTPGTGSFTTFTAAPTGTNDITLTTDSDSTLTVTGLQSGTGSALCIDGSNNVITCTVGAGGVSGSGTSGQIAFFNGASAITSESSGFSWDSTNNKLGIGTDSPTGVLTVTGAAIGKALAIFNETGDQNILTASASGTTAFTLGRTGTFTAYSTTTNADAISLLPQGAGSATFTGSITTADLTADRTYTLPDATGTVCLTTGNCAGVGGVGTMSSFNIAGDTGSDSVSDSQTVTIAGGTNGIDTSESGRTVTINLDTTEIVTTTFGSGSDFTWTFNGSGSTDPTIAFGSNSIALTGTTTIAATLSADSGSTQNVGSITYSSPVDTTGTNVSQGLNITPTIGNATGGTNTANVINIAAVTGDAQVSLNALNIGALTGTAATEYALSVGSGWDAALAVGGSSIINGSGVLQSAGLSGTYSNALTLSSTSNAFTGTIGQSTPLAGSFTTLSSTGVTTIGNNTATVAIDSSDWDISTTGDISGAGAITADGAIAFTPGSTSDITFTLDADSTLILSGVQSGTATSGLCLDTDNNVITCSTTGTVTLQTAYGNDADGSDTIIALTTADDSLIFQNPLASGTNSAFVLKIDQLATTAVDGIDIAQAGTGTGISLAFSNSGTTADGILISNSAGTLTDGIDISDATGITNAINVGANKILGTTGAIDYTNFDVSSAGAITVAAGVGIDTNASGILLVGDTTATTVSIGSTAATTLNLGAGGALTRAINIGTGTGADTISIGTGGTGADAITIGNTASSTALTLNSGTGGITATSTTVTGNALSLTDTALTTGAALSITASSAPSTAASVSNGAVFNFTNAAQTNATTYTGLNVKLTNNPSVAGNTEYGAAIQNQVTNNATDNAVAALLLLDNADTSVGGSTVVTDALRITNSGGISGGITNGINIASTSITTDIALQNGETIDNDTNGTVNIGTTTLSLTGGTTIVSDQATVALLNSATTTINFGSAATTLNIADAAITGTIDIGGVTADGASTVNIATNGTSADAITIGNSNASSTIAITGGDDWSISAAGTAVFNGNTTLGNANTDTITINAGSSGSGITLADTSFANCTLTTVSNVLTCGSAASGMTSFTLAGDSGGGQTITDGNTVSVLGGTNGIDTVDSATDTVTINLDTTEIGSTTFGSGSGFTWTFDAGATDPTIAFASNAITITAATSTFAGNVALGNNTLSGGTALIDLTNFDVASTGAITVAAGVGLDTNGAGALAIGNTNATSVSICNSAACDTISIGTNTDADAINIGDSTDTITVAGTTGITGATTINGSGSATTNIGTGTATGTVTVGSGSNALVTNSTTADIDATGALQINSSGGAISIGNDAVAQAINIGTGAAARTITIGNNTGATALALTSGTGAQTFTSSVATGTTTSSAFAFIDNSLTTGTEAYISSTSITQGKLLQLSSAANTLTSGTILDVTTTTTGLTTGKLGSFDWSPGSTTLATGDLFNINIGANGSTTGSIFSVSDGGTNLFSVSETAITSAIPQQFTAAGDVSMAYDLQFTNQTSSYIRSNAPLYLETGESYESNNLTLRTYNGGNILLDSGTGSSATGKIGVGPSVNPVGFFHVSNTNETALNGKALAVFDQKESQDILTASASGTTKFVIDSSGVPYMGSNASAGANTAVCWNSATKNGATVYQLGDCPGTPADIAEWYAAESNVQPGDAVALSNQSFTYEAGGADPYTNQVTSLGIRTTNVLKKAQPGDHVVGVISTGAFQTFGEDIKGAVETSNNASIKAVPLALTGRVPTNIDSSSPSINAGDRLMVTANGKVTKAFGTGSTLGTALESWNTGSSQSQIMVLVEEGFVAEGFENNNASSSGQLAVVDARLTTLENDFDTIVRSSLTATDSGILANFDDVKTNTLSVLGDTILSDTVINGKLNVGTLTFDNIDQSINAVGTLKIQSLALGNIELQGGLVVIDTLGNVVVNTITAQQYKVAGASAGVGTLTSGSTSVVINTSAVSANSLIFVTPKVAVTKPLAVTTKVVGSSFTVSVSSSLPQNVDFDWWIVEKTN